VFYDGSDYVEKLITALKSPVPEIPINTAMLLGKIKDARAVQPLIDCIENTDDVFIIREAVRALGEIGTSNAVIYLKAMRDHRANMVRDEVQSVLKRLDE
jgi:HEAT repeat protein